MSFTDVVLLMGDGSEWVSILFALWVKSVILLGTAAVLTHMLRGASARLRHLLWCAALSSLLVLPLFSGELQPLRLPILPAGLFSDEITEQQTSKGAAVKLPGQMSTSLSADPAAIDQSNLQLVDEQPLSSSFSWQSTILLIWLTGVLLVLGRYVFGVVRVQGLIRRATELIDASWSELSSELSQELNLTRPVRLLRSEGNIMPMTCGGISAVVLLPNEADDWPAGRRRVVVLHELIHIKRRDLVTQTLAQVVFALYWFNPIAWWAVRKLRREQEWACDEHVVATGVAAADYAGHLLEIARKFHADQTATVTAMAMARPSHLQERLCAILRPDHARYRSGRVIAVSLLVLTVVFMSTAVTQFVTAERQSETNPSSVTNDATQVEQKETLTVTHRIRQNTVGTDAAAQPAADDINSLDQTPSPTPINQPDEHSAGPPTDPPAASQDPVDNPTEEQVFNSFSAEERSRLLNNGIGPAYIKEMAGAGYRGLSVAQLIALFSNAVRADYVAALRSLGYSGLSTSDLLSLKTNGITADVIRSYRAATNSNFRPTNYIALRSNGVSPSYLRSLSAAGYDSLTAKQIVEMHLAGVTAEFIRDARSRGNTNLSPEELIEMKRRGKP